MRISGFDGSIEVRGHEFVVKHDGTGLTLAIPRIDPADAMALLARIEAAGASGTKLEAVETAVPSTETVEQPAAVKQRRRAVAADKAVKSADQPELPLVTQEPAAQETEEEIDVPKTVMQEEPAVHAVARLERQRPALRDQGPDGRERARGRKPDEREEDEHARGRGHLRRR